MNHVPDAASAGAWPTLTPQDPRYPDFAWGSNQRWIGTPDVVHLPSTAEQIRDCLQQAVTAGRRVAVRSGGHCYENFVGDPSVSVLIDLSRYRGVAYDPRHRAFSVESGARLGELYTGLYRDWGVTLPGGSCPTVGIGGHVAGGGFGPLSRRHGLTVDHLYAVEVATVDENGKAHLVTATREADDPNRDLWWAHTGGGGGNFGIVTRYWFRSPGIDGDDPAQLLPRPPSRMLVSTLGWFWPTMDEDSFVRLLGNYGTFFEHNSDPGSPYTAMFSQMNLTHKTAGGFAVTTVIDAAQPGAPGLLMDYLHHLQDGVAAESLTMEDRTLGWLHLAVQWAGLAATDTTTSFKAKSGYHRRGLTSESHSSIFGHLTADDYFNPTAGLMIMSHGGRVNSIEPAATAVAQRDSIIKMNYNAFWNDPAQDGFHLAWVRNFYRDVYASTGGVPAVTGATDGCFINYADADLADPAWNSSGQTWQQLYYKENYQRLLDIKNRWDPTGVFTHDLAIGAPAWQAATSA